MALRWGMDTSWDLRNYHYYNGWALLHGHIHRDLLVAQTAGFYNPLIDLPFAWAASWMDARLLAFLLGTLHGGNFILLTLLGESLLDDWAPAPRTRLAMLLAAAGCAGAVALSEIGTVFYDNVTSLGLFATLLLLMRRWNGLVAGHRWDALLAGLPLGLAFGLKQTMAPYPVGLCLALLLLLPASPARRFSAAFFFGIGVTVGLLATGGFWMVRLWQDYGNPVFPYFNQIFHSPWARPGDYRDIAFLPKGPAQWLFFPLFFAFDSRLTSEVAFQDYRLPLLFLLTLAAPFLGIGRRRRAALLLLAVAIAYLLWLKLFSIYRYLVAVEMLAPLLVAAILGFLPQRRRLLAILAMAAALLATTRPAQWIRMPFESRAVAVTIPPIADPEHSLVLIAGHEPLSFLIPAFPPTMRFLRIDSTFTDPQQTSVPFNILMKHEIDQHDGPLLALLIMSERRDVVRMLGYDGLRMITEGCRPVTSPLEAGDYELCPVERQ